MTPRKRDYTLVTEEGSVLLAGTFERCGNEVVKRCKLLAKGAGGWAGTAGTNAACFAWTIVGPDGAVRTRHAITALS
jgi:hypothetical protein